MTESEIECRISYVDSEIERLEYSIFVRLAYLEDVASQMAGFREVSDPYGTRSVKNEITQDNWDYAYGENETMLDEVHQFESDLNELLGASIDLQGDLTSFIDENRDQLVSRVLEESYFEKVDVLHSVETTLEENQEESNSHDDDASEFDVCLPLADDTEIDFLETGIAILEDNMSSVLALSADGTRHTLRDSYLAVYENLETQLYSYNDMLDQLGEDAAKFLLCLRCSNEVSDLDSHDHCAVCADEILELDEDF